MRNMKRLLVLLLFIPLTAHAKLSQAVIYPTHANLTWAMQTPVPAGHGSIEIDGLPSTVSEPSIVVALEGSSGILLQSHQTERTSSGSTITVQYHADKADTLTVQVRLSTTDLKWENKYIANLQTQLDDRPGGVVLLQNFGDVHEPKGIDLAGVKLMLASAPSGPILAVGTGQPINTQITIANHRLPVDVEAWLSPKTDHRSLYVATGTLPDGIPVLPGTAEMYRDGKPVGNTLIPRLQRRDRFALIFGIDEGVRVEAITSGGDNRTTDPFSHIRLTNNHAGAVPVRIFNEIVNLAALSGNASNYAQAFVLNPGSAILPFSGEQTQ